MISETIQQSNNEIGSVAKKYATFPIEHKDLWKFYKKAVATFGFLKKLIYQRIQKNGKIS